MTTISVITPTFHREDLLARCAQSVLSQEVDARIEYFVVNDAGEPLSHAPWMDDPRVTVLNTYRTEKCVARNTGAALSQGQWLQFLDDDDYLLPGAFAAMLEATQAGNPAFVYGGYQTVNETTKEVVTITPAVRGDIAHMVIAGEFVPLQATWFRRDVFFAAGGFDPLFLATEDVDMVRRVGLLGEVAGTPFVVSVVRIAHPQTTKSQHSKTPEYWNKGAEKCLEMPQTLPQITRATRASSYWRGRVAREYVSSAGRNLKARQVTRALSRAASVFRLGAPHLLAGEFWRGLKRA